MVDVADFAWWHGDRLIFRFGKRRVDLRDFDQRKFSVSKDFEQDRLFNADLKNEKEQRKETMNSIRFNERRNKRSQQRFNQTILFNKKQRNNKRMIFESFPIKQTIQLQFLFDNINKKKKE